MARNISMRGTVFSNLLSALGVSNVLDYFPAATDLAAKMHVTHLSFHGPCCSVLVVYHLCEGICYKPTRGQ